MVYNIFPCVSLYIFREIFTRFFFLLHFQTANMQQSPCEHLKKYIRLSFLLLITHSGRKIRNTKANPRWNETVMQSVTTFFASQGKSLKPLAYSFNLLIFILYLILIKNSRSCFECWSICVLVYLCLWWGEGIHALCW